MKKEIIIDLRASKEIGKFPKAVRIKIRAYADLLGKTGELRKPFAKKLTTKPALYEIRVRYRGIWRVLYAYFGKNEIIILSAFHKKSQATPLREIERAIRRLKDYMRVI